MTQKKKEVEDKADEYESAKVDNANEHKSPEYTSDEKAKIKAEIAKAKKIGALYNELAAKWNVLNKLLTEQGLGQNARQKVVVLVKEIRTWEEKIVKEEI